jgi:hypothetical protein
MEMNEKEMYEKRAELKLQELGSKIDQLKAKADGLVAKKKEKYYKRVENLRSEMNRVSENLSKMKETSQDAWVGMKKSFDKSLKNLEDGFNTAASRVKKLIS